MKRKSRLSAMTEKECWEEGLTRKDLIEAVELAFLYNRASMAAWARQMMQWKEQENWCLEEAAGIGLLRREMEWLYGVDQAESLAAVQSLTDGERRLYLGIIWKDGEGRNQLSVCAAAIYSNYKSYKGGDVDDSEEVDYTDY